MPFDSITLEKRLNGMYVIFLKDTKEHRTQGGFLYDPMSREDAMKELRRLGASEEDILQWFAEADNAAMKT